MQLLKWWHLIHFCIFLCPNLGNKLLSDVTQRASQGVQKSFLVPHQKKYPLKWLLWKFETKIFTFKPFFDKKSQKFQMSIWPP